MGYNFRMRGIRLSRFVGVGFAALVLVLTAKPVFAAFFDREKLASAIAWKFGLDQKQVSEFLADFQYNPEKYATREQVQAVSATSGPSVRSDAAVKKTEKGVVYEFDEYTDQYYPVEKIVDIQHRNNLKFVEEKLQAEVARGAITSALKKEIMDKLAQMMKGAPSTSEFLQMNYFQQRARINEFRREMDDWMKTRGMTLAQLRAITGKGNKFLMGIYY